MEFDWEKKGGNEGRGYHRHHYHQRLSTTKPRGGNKMKKTGRTSGFVGGRTSKQQKKNRTKQHYKWRPVTFRAPSAKFGRETRQRIFASVVDGGGRAILVAPASMNTEEHTCMLYSWWARGTSSLFCVEKTYTDTLQSRPPPPRVNRPIHREILFIHHHHHHHQRQHRQQQ